MIITSSSCLSIQKREIEKGKHIYTNLDVCYKARYENNDIPLSISIYANNPILGFDDHTKGRLLFDNLLKEIVEQGMFFSVSENAYIFFENVLKIEHDINFAIIKGVNEHNYQVSVAIGYRDLADYQIKEYKEWKQRRKNERTYNIRSF